MLLLVECNCFVRLKEWFWTESWQHTGWGSFKIRQKYPPPPPPPPPPPLVRVAVVLPLWISTTLKERFSRISRKFGVYFPLDSRAFNK